MFSERKCGSSHALLVFLFLLVSASVGIPAGSTLFGGNLQRQVYSDLDGTLLSDLLNAATYPDQPDEVGEVSQFESPVDTADRYGQRIHGFIVPPITGTYIFGIASDDQGALFLSSDETPANAREIASVLTWTNFREWSKEPNQESVPIFLQAGRLYYVSALMKEFFGGDHVSVRWVRPDGIEEGPIPGDYLLPFGVAIHEPSVTRPPSDTTVMEGEMANFRVEWDPLGPADFQWQKDGADIPGETGATLQLGPVTLGESGARVRVILRNSQGEAISPEAIMTVRPDTVSPQPVAAFNEGSSRIHIRWTEPLLPDGVADTKNYTLFPPVALVSAALANDPREILLNTGELAMGINYVLSIQGVFDRAATPNPVSPGTQVSFTASEFAPATVGTNLLNGTITRTNGGFDISSRGSGLAGSSDEIQFAWQRVSGDFDMEVRVARLASAAAWGQAGLIARMDSSASAPFAAAIASSVQLGCVFKARSAPGEKAVTRCEPGHFPVNYPQTWLRLKRVGDSLTGYASVDAKSWTELGRAQVPNLPMEIEGGLTVASVHATRNSVVQFRDYGATRHTEAASTLKGWEPLGPSSRATGMVISEIMYHPAPRTDTFNLEYVELYNAGTVFQDLSGWRLSGAIEFQFPDPFTLEAGEFVVVAADPGGMAAVYGLEGVLGPFSNRLENGSGDIRLRNEQNAVMLEASYSSGSNWPAAADGAGHSLVLGHPSFGERDRRAWIASARVGGSPGENDAIYPSDLNAIVINEFLANSEAPRLDFLELYNHGNTPVDLGGCQLSDTAGNYRYRIPAGTQIAAGGYVFFDENQLGFRLEANGESVFLGSPDGTHVIDAIHFDGQVQNISAGRWPDGSSEVRPLAQPTPGNPNASLWLAPVVINEIMYHLPGGSEDGEYIEIHNPGTGPVSLAGWRMEGGIAYEFPANTQIVANAFLVIAKNRDSLLTRYPQLAPANVVGNFSGSLRNSGDHIALAMPQLQTTTNSAGQPVVEKFYAVISEVDYRDGGQWGRWADGGGSSLELTDPRVDPMRASNWADSDESQKGEWRSFELTGRLDNGNFSFPPSRNDFPIAPDPQLQIILQEAGEVLIDDVQVESADGTSLLQNGGFESNATNSCAPRPSNVAAYTPSPATSSPSLPSSCISTELDCREGSTRKCNVTSDTASGSTTLARIFTFSPTAGSIGNGSTS